eukprot:Skav215628  [mRNA]  locus=scaffold620:109255:111697:+ [translate_table: standard]
MLCSFECNATRTIPTGSHQRVDLVAVLHSQDWKIVDWRLIIDTDLVHHHVSGLAQRAEQRAGPCLQVDASEVNLLRRTTCYG